MDALFHIDGPRFVPTELTTGPWRPDAMHGGPPAALVGRAVSAAAGSDEHVARLNVELVRPVPLEPLRVDLERRPVSRRVAHVVLEVSVGDTVVTTATAVLLRIAEIARPDWTSSTNWPSVPSEEASTTPAPAFGTGNGITTYHQHAVEHRMTAGSFESPGPAVSWIRLLHPLVAGESTAPLATVLAAADFGSGISAVYRPGAPVGLINADLSVALARPPSGNWIRVAAVTTAHPSGHALTVSELGDERGPVGVATQSLLGLQL